MGQRSEFQGFCAGSGMDLQLTPHGLGFLAHHGILFGPSRQSLFGGCQGGAKRSAGGGGRQPTPGRFGKWWPGRWPQASRAATKAKSRACKGIPVFATAKMPQIFHFLTHAAWHQHPPLKT